MRVKQRVKGKESDKMGEEVSEYKESKHNRKVRLKQHNSSLLKRYDKS